MNRVIVPAFFTIILILGLFLIKDYGISWDESRSRENGIVTTNYIVKGDQELIQYRDRDYGVFFEVILVVLERSLNLTNDSRALYLMRHTATFLLFFLSLIFFYLLCKKIFHEWQPSLLACLFLILSPRIFADAFYNSKDIPCLSLFIISTYTLIQYLENKTHLNALLHALVTAMLIDIRIVGIIVPCLTFFFTFTDIFIIRSKNINVKRDSLSFLTYSFCLIIFILLFWPYLWSSPLNNFINALSAMSHFRWRFSVLYLGQYIPASDLPWHYLPVWIAISTPLLYVITFCIGFMRTSTLAGKNFIKFYRYHQNELIILFLFSSPLLVIILLKSVVYDGWRQIYFVYPFFLILSIIGLRSLFDFLKQKTQSIFPQRFLIFLIILNLSCVVLFMIRNHPYENIYFNSLAGPNMKEIKQRFELDYWGLSYTKALEYLVKNDPSSPIKIYLDNYPESMNTGMLTNKDSKRLVFVNNLNDAKYFLSDYRWQKEDYLFKNEFYSINVDGAKIVVLYRLYG